MAAQGCCACAKYMLFILNILFLLGGLASTGLGIYSLVHAKGDLGDVIDSRQGTFGGVLIAVGVLSCCLSAAGCLGAVREHRCALLTYAVALGIVFIMEGAAGGLGYHYRHKLRKIVDDGMTSSLNAYDPAVPKGKLENAWNQVQKTLHCCGVDAPRDWLANSTKWGKAHPTSYPLSCCKTPAGNSCTNTTTSGFRNDGCLEKVVKSLHGKWTIWAGSAVALALIQLVGIISACALQRHIKRTDYALV